jgi:hypothetical protein
MAKLYTKNTWQDEILSGAERYDIKEDGGTSFKSDMQIVLKTGVTQAGTLVDADKMNNLENGLDTMDNLLLGVAPESQYRISVTVASNNITVAIKDVAGNDFSATNSGYFRINNTMRTITAALSVTKNAGTNWFNAGGAELATKEIDYFVYLIWNTTPATDIMDIGFSRIPYGRVYSDFSGTTTNEKYLAFGNASTPTSTDDVINIGRFAATLSAGAGYTWSVPTFTTKNLINEPVYETRPLVWAPQHSRTGGAYSNLPTVNLAQYMVDGRKLKVFEKHTQHGTPGSSGYQRLTMPFTNGLADANIMNGVNVNTGIAFTLFCYGSNISADLFKYDGTSEATASQIYTIDGEMWL